MLLVNKVIVLVLTGGRVGKVFGPLLGWWPTPLSGFEHGVAEVGIPVGER